MKKEDCYELGFISKTKGLDGELFIQLDVDDPEDYQELESVFVEIKQNLVPYFIEYIDFQDKKVVVRFEDIDSLEDAHTLVGCKLFLPLDNLPPLEDGQFYYHEVINFQIIDQTLGKLGIITNIYETGNQDLIAMLYQGREILIPLVDEFVLKINREEKILEVNLPEGLLDIYLEE
ncbi:MAG: ribosome maturation factor RimM [Microscillaceae bacterium]|nr:ribosome maturation factor RimM [Microscillaceae bacterium]